MIDCDEAYAAADEIERLRGIVADRKDDTLVTLSIPPMMMPDILTQVDEGESLHDCLLDLIWISVLRAKERQP